MLEEIEVFCVEVEVWLGKVFLLDLEDVLNKLKCWLLLDGFLIEEKVYVVFCNCLICGGILFLKVVDRVV